MKRKMDSELKKFSIQLKKYLDIAGANFPKNKPYIEKDLGDSFVSYFSEKILEKIQLLKKDRKERAVSGQTLKIRIERHVSVPFLMYQIRSF